ncbi:MAG: hypothetical protein AAFY56_07775 [Pseudomonadota bacterium]
MPDHEAFFEDHIIPEDRQANLGVASLLAGWAVVVIVFGALVFI